MATPETAARIRRHYETEREGGGGRLGIVLAFVGMALVALGAAKQKFPYRF